MTLSPAIWVPAGAVILVAILAWFSSHQSAVLKEGESLRKAYREETLQARTQMETLVEKLDSTNEILEATRQELTASRLESAETRIVNVRLLDELRIARGEK
jgi:nitrogen fixation/metabolism regulation signal transduction histidine kinase